MAEIWARYECDFLTGDRLLGFPLGARWLYVELWAYAHKQRRQVIRRPTNKWLADHFGLQRHPIAEYLQELDDDGLIILTDTTIELPGLRKKHGRYNYKDGGSIFAAQDNAKAKKKSDSPESLRGKVKTSKKKKASEDAKKETTGTVANRLVQYFHDTYKEKRGTKYRVVGARDMAIFKKLLQADSEEKIKAAIDKFFLLNGDRYLTEQGYSVPAFKTRFQYLIEKVDSDGARAPVGSKAERLKP